MNQVSAFWWEKIEKKQVLSINHFRQYWIVIIAVILKTRIKNLMSWIVGRLLEKR